MDQFATVRRRMTVTLFTVQSLFSAATIASFTLMSIIGSQLGGSDSFAGFPSTVGLVGRAVVAYPIGWMMDKIGRRVGLSFGLGLGVIGSALAAWGVYSASFTLFLVGAAMMGMARSGSEQSRYVAAEIQLPENKSRAIGWIVSAGTVGAVGGPLLVAPSAHFSQLLGFTSDMGPFILSALLMLIGLLLLSFFLRPDPKQLAAAEAVDNADASSPKRSIGRVLVEPPVFVALSSMSIGQLVMTMLMVITPLLMKRLGYGAPEISLVIMAHTLGMFALAWLTGGLVTRFGRVTIMFTGGLILVASALMSPVATTVPALAVALFLLGLGWNFCFVAGSSMLTDTVAAEEKGRLQGASELIVALSSGAASLASGALFDLGGMAAASYVGLALVLALLGIIAWFSFSRRQLAEPA